MIDGTIATAFEDLTSFELFAWLHEGSPTAEEAEAIETELTTRQQRLEAIADLLW